MKIARILLHKIRMWVDAKYYRKNKGGVWEFWLTDSYIGLGWWFHLEQPSNPRELPDKSCIGATPIFREDYRDI